METQNQMLTNRLKDLNYVQSVYIASPQEDMKATLLLVNRTLFNMISIAAIRLGTITPIVQDLNQEHQTYWYVGLAIQFL